MKKTAMASASHGSNRQEQSRTAVLSTVMAFHMAKILLASESMGVGACGTDWDLAVQQILLQHVKYYCILEKEKSKL
jgi:hypothetical protein